VHIHKEETESFCDWSGEVRTGGACMLPENAHTHGCVTSSFSNTSFRLLHVSLFWPPPF